MQTFSDALDLSRQRDAWLLANLLAPWSTERLTPSDFYESPKVKQIADKAAALRTRAEELDRRG